MFKNASVPVFMSVPVILNYNKNENENKKKDYIDTTYIDSDLNIYTNLVNIKCF